MSPQPNKSMEPTGASRSAQLQFLRRRRLAPAAHAWRSAKEMNAIIVSLFLCLMLAGCGSHDVAFVNSADPALATKLGITDQDWRQVQQLASERKDFVILDIGRVAPDALEVRFKKPDDRRNDQGGPMARFEKHEGHWVKQTNFDGNWWAARGSGAK